VSNDNERFISALLRERSSLESTGKTDRVAQVDAQLKEYGYTFPEKEAGKAPETPETPDAPKRSGDPKRQAPQGRSANGPKQSTGD
jgi:hypothetical protein